MSRSNGKPTHVDLMRRCLAGEPGAWDQFVERFARLVYSVPRRYGLSSADAEDVMQTVFVAAFRSLAKIDDARKLSAWLMTSAHRESWRVGRRRGTIASTGTSAGTNPTTGRAEAIVDVDAPPEEAIERWELQDRVNRALAEIDGRCQDLLRSLYFRRADSNYAAVANELEMPIGSIGPTRARCLRKLEKVLCESAEDVEHVMTAPSPKVEPRCQLKRGPRP